MSKQPLALYTELQAIEAIRARLDGRWDNKQLMRLGPISFTLTDIERIVRETETRK